MARVKRPVGERFWSKVRILDDGCWLWTAALLKASASGSGGYGLFDDEKTMLAHIWVYRATIGPVPVGKQLDHLCRNRACVNPLHLEPVTCRQNILRGEGLAAVNAKKTHCIHGHPFSGENLGKQSQNGKYKGRKCKMCAMLQQRVRRSKQKQNYERHC